MVFKAKKALPRIRTKVWVKVLCEGGLNILCATHWRERFRRFRSKIRVRYKSYEADGKNILSLLTLGAARDSRLEVEFSGDDAEQAKAELDKESGIKDGNPLCP